MSYCATQAKTLSQEYYQKIRQYYGTDLNLFDSLLSLHQKKQDIIEQKKQGFQLEKPFVITVSGTPRAGKTTCIDTLYEFFKKADLKTDRLQEPAGLVYATLKTKEEKQELLKRRVDFVDRQYEIGIEHISKALTENEVILCDRGVLDTYIWYQMYATMGMVKQDRYDKFFSSLSRKTTEYINYFYGLYTDPTTSLERDYQNSLSIEPRTTMSPENIVRYNRALLEVMPLYEPFVDHATLIDTSHLRRLDASMQIANQVMDDIKGQYIKRRGGSVFCKENQGTR